LRFLKKNAVHYFFALFILYNNNDLNTKKITRFSLLIISSDLTPIINYAFVKKLIIELIKL